MNSAELKLFNEHFVLNSKEKLHQAIQSLRTSYQCLKKLAQSHQCLRNIKRQVQTKIKLETMVNELPNLSIRKAASAVGVSPTLIYHVLHDDMHLKPYKYQTWHKLEVHDHEPRLKFAQWFLAKPPATKSIFIFSDEAYFSLTLPLNKQNNRTWADSNPYNGIELPLHDEKVLVWCAISAERIFGPYFFSESVNQHNYLEMIQTFNG